MSKWSRRQAWIKRPKEGMTYYKGKMIDRKDIPYEPTKNDIPDKWKRLGIKIQ